MDDMWTKLMQMISCETLSLDDSFKIRKIIYAGGNDSPVFHGQRTVMNGRNQVAAYMFMRTGSNIILIAKINLVEFSIHYSQFEKDLKTIQNMPLFPYLITILMPLR